MNVGRNGLLLTFFNFLFSMGDYQILPRDVLVWDIFDGGCLWCASHHSVWNSVSNRVNSFWHTLFQRECAQVFNLYCSFIFNVSVLVFLGPLLSAVLVRILISPSQEIIRFSNLHSLSLEANTFEIFIYMYNFEL